MQSQTPPAVEADTDATAAALAFITSEKDENQQMPVGDSAGNGEAAPSTANQFGGSTLPLAKGTNPLGEPAMDDAIAPLA